MEDPEDDWYFSQDDRELYDGHTNFYEEQGIDPSPPSEETADSEPVVTAAGASGPRPVV